MYPLFAAALGSLAGTVVVATLALCVVIFCQRAYDPAVDAYAQNYSSVDYLKPPADGLEHLILTLTPDNEYPTGGFTTLGLADHATGDLEVLKLRSIVDVQIEMPVGGYSARWNPANGKILVYRIPEIGAAGAGDDDEAAQPLEEVAAGVDLSAKTMRMHVWGIRDSRI